MLVGTDAQEVQPALSSTGKQLAYASNASGKFQIYVRDLESGMDRQLTDLPGGATYPAWSPDDSQIVLIAGVRVAGGETGDVMTVNVTSGETRVVLGSDADAGAPAGRYFSPVFAAADLILTGDSSSLIGIRLGTLETYDIVPFNGRIPNPQDPSPAPGGNLFVFSDYCGGERQLFVARIDGTTGDTCASALPLAKLSQGVQAPSWGPDGLIAAETTDGNLALMRADGAGAAFTFIDVPGPARHPHFAPPGLTLTCP